MALTSQDVARIAQLARLELRPHESETMLSQINNFFDLTLRMAAIDTAGVVPLAHPLDVVQEVPLRLRDDIASEPSERDANQQNAPAVERGLFLVPRVIE